MSDKHLEDKQLIESAKEDLGNFKALYEKYVRVVYRYCYHRLGRSKERAEDITSDTFVKAIEKFDSFEYQSKPFVVWLYTIAHNLIVDYYRKKGERNVSLEALVIPPADEKEEIIDTLSREELKDRVNETAALLPDEVNHLFTLRHSEGLTFTEIGKLLGMTEGAGKMKYYRGLKLLKRLLAQKK